MKKFNEFISGLSGYYTVIGFTLGIPSVSVLSTCISNQTKFLDDFGNFKYAIIFSIFCLLYSLCFYLYSKSKKYLSEIALDYKFLEQRQSINLLESEFHKKIIKCTELWMPHKFIIKNKKFQDCRFDGPMVFALGIDTVAYKGVFLNCNFVNSSKNINTMIYGAVSFENCDFTNCEFNYCTLFSTKDILNKIVEKENIF